jgi:hypothetical protein
VGAFWVVVVVVWKIRGSSTEARDLDARCDVINILADLDHLTATTPLLAFFLYLFILG